MLDPGALENDARPIPLTRRTSGIPGRRRDQIVEAPRSLLRRQGLGEAAIVDQLVLETERAAGGAAVARKVLVDVVLDPAVGAYAHPPLESELEIDEGLAGDEIAAEDRLAVR